MRGRGRGKRKRSYYMPATVAFASFSPQCFRHICHSYHSRSLIFASSLLLSPLSHLHLYRFSGTSSPAKTAKSTNSCMIETSHSSSSAVCHDPVQRCCVYSWTHIRTFGVERRHELSLEYSAHGNSGRKRHTSQSDCKKLVSLRKCWIQLLLPSS